MGLIMKLRCHAFVDQKDYETGRDYKMTVPDVVCVICKHYTGDSEKDTCKAFPEGIPHEIL